MNDEDARESERECRGSHLSSLSWQSISSEMIKCPDCGWITHIANPRSHSKDAAAIQDKANKEMAEFADNEWRKLGYKR